MVSIGGGPHATEKACRKEALKQTKFRRLLLNRCQDEFDNNEPYADLEKQMDLLLILEVLFERFFLLQQLQSDVKG